MKAKSVTLLLIGLMSWVSGAVDQYFYPGRSFPPTVLVYSLAYTLLIFMWFRQDTDERDYKRSPTLNAGIIGLSLVALPYYFFRSRGAMRGMLATFVFVVALVAASVLMNIGQITVYLALQR